MFEQIVNAVPEVVVVGNVEFLFLGMAFALGSEKTARRILRRRYGSDNADGEDAE